MEGLDLSILDSMNIPDIDAKTTRKETINMPEEVDTNSDENVSAMASAIEVESFEDLIKKQKSEDSEKETTEDDTTVDSTENVDSTASNEVTDETTDEVESPNKIWAEWAKEKGFIDFQDDEFEDSEEFLEKKYIESVKKDVKSEIEAYKEEMPDVIKSLLENYEDGVPLKELIESKSKEMEYSKISASKITEDEKLQEKLVKEWLKVQEFDEDEIDEKLQDYKDSGLMEKEAKTAHNKLLKHEVKYQKELEDYAKEQKVIQEKRVQEGLKKLEQDINSKNEIIQGIELSKEAKGKVFTGLTKRDAKGLTEIEKKMSDPEMQLKVAQFVLLHNGSIDDILKAAKTKVAKDTKTAVTTYKEKTKLNSVDMSVIKAALKKK